jgi:hypothetical protein
VKFLLAALALIASTAGQVVAPTPPTPVPYSYDCSMLPYTSAGCDSYNQMVVKQDKDVLSNFAAGGEGLVCFRPDEDFFSVVSYESPGSLRPTSGQNPSLLQSNGSGGYESFKEGVLHDNDFVSGKWTEVKGMDTSLVFRGNGFDPKTPTSLDVTDTEVDYSTTFENLDNTKTTYTLQIRLSTLRFSESYTYPDSQSKTARAEEVGYSGYCAQFKATH